MGLLQEGVVVVRGPTSVISCTVTASPLLFHRCTSSEGFPLQVEDGSAIWDAPLTASVAVTPLLPQTSQVEEEEFQLQLPACPKDLRVIVCHVNSPGSFYVRLSRSVSRIQR